MTRASLSYLAVVVRATYLGTDYSTRYGVPTLEDAVRTRRKNCLSSAGWHNHRKWCLLQANPRLMQGCSRSRVSPSSALRSVALIPSTCQPNLGEPGLGPRCVLDDTLLQICKLHIRRGLLPHTLLAFSSWPSAPRIRSKGRLTRTSFLPSLRFSLLCSFT